MSFMFAYIIGGDIDHYEEIKNPKMTKGETKALMFFFIILFIISTAFVIYYYKYIL